MSVARQQAGIFIHGDKVVASPIHGGKVPLHGGQSPLHGDPNLDPGGADTTAPVLSGAGVNSITGTSAIGNVTTNEGNGTLYHVVTTSATPPTAAQVKLGQNNLGGAAVLSGSQAIGSVGAKSANLTGLASQTVYYIYFMQEDSSANQSTVASATFTTADVTAPVLSSPTGTKTGSTSADLSVTTNEGNGMLYWVVTGSPTTPSKAQIKAGQDHTGAAALASGSVVVSSTGLKTASTTALTAATTYYAHYMQEDAALNQSNNVSSGSFTTDALGGLSTPVLSRFSSAGAAPLVLTFDNADYSVGLYGQLQIDNNSDFSSPEQNVVFFIDGSDFALNDETISMVTPSGTYYARLRMLRDNEAGATTVTDELGNTFNADASAWSNTVTDTISSSVNVLPSADGVNRSQYMSTSGTPVLSYILEADVGSFIAARGLTAQVPQKGHSELTVDGWFSGSDGGVYAGVCDVGTVTTFATFGQQPGVSSVPGCSAKLGKNATTLDVSANGSTTTYALGVNAAVGDKIIIECDKVANTVAFYVWDASAGALVNGGAPLVTVTLTGVYIPTAFYHCVAGRRGSNVAGVSDAGTVNYGASAFSMTPSTGYSGW